MTLQTLADEDIPKVFSDSDRAERVLEQGDVANLRAVILHDYSVSLDEWVDSSPGLRRVEAVVTALRLVTGHGIKLFSLQDHSLDPFLDRGYVMNSRVAADPSRGSAVSLSMQEFDSVRDTWAALQRCVEGQPNLALALARFDSAVTRRPSGDRLIDAWIALETLFTPDSSAEIRFRASMLIPMYIPGTPDERLALHKTIKASYDLRSKIVHGSPSASGLRPEQHALIDHTIDVLRRALLRAVTDGTIEPTEIDNSLLRS